jgi:glycerol-3-phosphate acyltransferase PlsX
MTETASSAAPSPSLTPHSSLPPLSQVVVALDAMGGDYAPQATVEGAVLAARKWGITVELVGNEALLLPELAKHNTKGLNLPIVHTVEVIDMDEAPAVSLRKKRNASIALSARRVKEGHAHAMVAAGSTGAAMAAALLTLGRLHGVDRPAIGLPMPRIGHPCLLIDAGANVDCDKAWLHQFALMGQAYMQGLFGIEHPKVGLLNIGTEEGKGNRWCHEAFDYLTAAEGFHFVGNAEGRDLFLGERCDVIVADGFHGNVALKAAEGMISLALNLLKREFMASPANKLVALLVKPLLQKALRPLRHEEVGGSLLLGVKGLCVIAHGGSSGYAIAQALKVGATAAQAGVLQKMEAAFVKAAAADDAALHASAEAPPVTEP